MRTTYGKRTQPIGAAGAEDAFVDSIADDSGRILRDSFRKLRLGASPDRFAEGFRFLIENLAARLACAERCIAETGGMARYATMLARAGYPRPTRPTRRRAERGNPDGGAPEP